MDKARMNFFNMLGLFVFVLIVFIIFFVVPAMWGWTSTFAPARTITVSAQGMTTATPDMAEISFSVMTQGQDPQALTSNNDVKMNSVIQFVASQEIASSDIATTGYDLESNYVWDKVNSRNTIDGYTLTQTVEVKIRDLTKVASVLGGLTPLGVNNISGVNFTFQDPNKFLGIARGDALAKAVAQASEMAAQAGAQLGEVVNVGDSGNVPYPRPVYAAAGEGMAASSPTVAPNIQPGTQDVTDEVTVTYSLR